MDHTADHGAVEDSKDMPSAETANDPLRPFDKTFLRAGRGKKPSEKANSHDVNEHLTATYWG